MGATTQASGALRRRSSLDGPVPAAGRRQLIETYTVGEEDGGPALPLASSSDDADELGYLAGRRLAELNRRSTEATRGAPRRSVPTQTLRLPAWTPTTGHYCIFLERACGHPSSSAGVNVRSTGGGDAYRRTHVRAPAKPGTSETNGSVRAPESPGKRIRFPEACGDAARAAGCPWRGRVIQGTFRDIGENGLNTQREAEVHCRAGAA
jgi:hypothetical protein